MARRRSEEWMRIGPQPLDLGPQRRWPAALAAAAVLIVIVVVMVVVR
jgi:hypothetical protein